MSSFQSDLSIRPALTSDAVEIARLYTASRQPTDYEQVINPAARRDEVQLLREKMFKTELLNENYHAIVAELHDEDGGKIIIGLRIG